MYAMICTQLHLKIKHCKSGNFKLYFITPGRCQEYSTTAVIDSNKAVRVFRKQCSQLCGYKDFVYTLGGGKLAICCQLVVTF